MNGWSSFQAVRSIPSGPAAEGRTLARTLARSSMLGQGCADFKAWQKLEEKVDVLLADRLLRGHLLPKAGCNVVGIPLVLMLVVRSDIGEVGGPTPDFPPRLDCAPEHFPTALGLAMRRNVLPELLLGASGGEVLD